MIREELVAIPGTARTTWPGSRQVESLTSDDDVLLTAWLRPIGGGELDAAAAHALGATPPLHRTYANRKTLARQTGADPRDLDRLRDYCKPFGITIEDSQWRSATIRGSIDSLVRAFGATVAVYEDEIEQRFRHRSEALYVPAPIREIVQGIFGLHQWPRSRKIGPLQRHATPLVASDVAARYRFPEGDGSGQTIGVMQLRGTFSATDFNQSMRAQNVAPALPVIKRVDEAAVVHELATTKDLEAALDVQILGALAPGARIVVYEAPDDERGFLDAIREAIFDEEYAPSVLSISYGWPEQLWTPVALDILNELLIAAALIGVSVFCSSGDNGAEIDDAGQPHVLAPASSPFAHACGATVLPAENGGRELAWEKTGGGFSEHFDVPAWQNVAQSPAAHYGVKPGRGVPDVSAQQLPGYYVVMDGTELAMGGTSAIAPMWSALTARIAQRLGVPIGFFAPLLYQRSGDAVFGDVLEGNNGRFNAAAGWNPCTGLGVPIGVEIENALRGSSP